MKRNFVVFVLNRIHMIFIKNVLRFVNSVRRLVISKSQMVIINVKTVKKSAATLKLKKCDHLEKDRMLEGT